MIVKNVTFYIKSEHIKEFIEATVENQQNSIKEEGIVSFDFLQCKDDQTKFLLYESYKSEEDINKHLETEHFKKWIKVVEQWFSSPRDRVTYIPVSK
ncbi:Antibiotic biosynthesis monooxygenase [Clostridium sp. DL-VIII]|uniref:putative quinol monooxygenase n=1 Tax=Clostridium sp. DL-VIII TaxID=641107 RepID=UPI00023B04D5|nr:putative quinol monooxygenase [Clostridium sp. DL-VIII]EHJ00806.1 Antibiotic biosynthesis monooxygenase [Clostridium sp. DL-VIII]